MCNASLHLSIEHRPVQKVEEMKSVCVCVCVTEGLCSPQVSRTYCSGTYRSGPMRQISLVGAVDEEVGNYFPEFLDMLEESPFLKVRGRFYRFILGRGPCVCGLLWEPVGLGLRRHVAAVHVLALLYLSLRETVCKRSTDGILSPRWLLMRFYSSLFTASSANHRTFPSGWQL